MCSEIFSAHFSAEYARIRQISISGFFFYFTPRRRDDIFSFFNTTHRKCNPGMFLPTQTQNFSVFRITDKRLDISAFDTFFSLYGRIPFINAFWYDYFFYRQIKSFRKFKIAFIVCRYRHHRAGTIRTEHIISNENRNFFFSRWINRGNTFELNACFLFILASFSFCLFLCRINICFYLRRVCEGGLTSLNEWMFWRKHDIGRAKHGVRPRGKNLDGFQGRTLEFGLEVEP